MADGTQSGFNFPRHALVSALRPGEIVVDFFAGGGGASEALRQALGRDPDVAVNHDHLAIGMHAANHPFTRHMEADVWTVDTLREVAGRPVGWFHASPDCTHFSQAKGGQPRSRATRSLSWVVLKVAGTLVRAGLAPRIISLENVEQILTWGPLVAKRCKATGRVIKLDGTIAAPGEQVSVWQQALVPDKRHAGRTWQQFVAALRAIGYAVEWRKLIASDYGAGTSRKRLFLIARRDGQPIAWPAPTHGKGADLLPLVTAADCIDFGVPCPSIFTRKKPLADATLRRIAKGLKRYVIDAAEPFIVQCANASANGVAASSEPLGTITAWPKGGTHALVAPTLVQASHGEGSGATKRRGSGAHDPQQPLGTVHAGGGSFALASALLIGVGGRAGDTDPRPANQPGYTTTAKADCAVVTAFLEQANGGYYDGAGNDLRKPAPTICGTGSQQRLVTAKLLRTGSGETRGLTESPDVHRRLEQVRVQESGDAPREPESVHQLSPEHEAGALRVAAFLINYYGNGQALDLREPVDTVTTRDRLALVTVTIKGTPYVIVDIGLRMLRREELFRAQGFPPDYIIDRTADGTPLSISASVRMVGNSVSPPPLAAIARVNLDTAQVAERAAA